MCISGNGQQQFYVQAIPDEYFYSGHGTIHFYVHFISLFSFNFRSGKLLKAEYILSSLINDNGATGTYKFLFQLRTCCFGAVSDPNFSSYTSLK